MRVLWVALLATGLALAAYLLTRNGPAALWIASLAAIGFSVGAAMTGASSAVMLSAPEDRAGMAASVEEVSYELGGALGVALLGSLMTAIYTRSLTLPDHIAIAPEARDSLDEALILSEALPADQAAEVTSLARMAFENAFIGVTVVAVVVLIGVALLIGRKAYSAPRQSGTASSAAR